MKTKISPKTAMLAACCSLLFISSCKKNETPIFLNPAQSSTNIFAVNDSVFKGPKVNVFGGKAWVWVKLDSNGVPNQLAITLTNTVLATVPTDSSEVENEIIIQAPPQVNITAFHDFAIDWSPRGHEPDSVYGIPLFDFHFYKITETERQAIFTDPGYDQNFGNYPSQQYLPAGYGLVKAGGIPGGGCLTGAHWYFLNGPEYKGKVFKQTFVYGTYNRKVDFYDPMMTLQFLKNVQSFERNIPQPAKFTPNSYYPTKLTVLKHDGVTDIILEKFILRPTS